MMSVVRGNGLRALLIALMIGLLGSVCVLLRLSLPFSWERLLFFLNLALPFAGVGSLAWSVGHSRPAARLFSLHCLTVMVFLAIPPSSAPAMVCLGMLARIGAGVLLLRFLRALAADYRAQLAQQAPGHYRLWRWYRLLVEGLGGCCALVALLSLRLAALTPFVGMLFSSFVVLALGGGCVWSVQVARHAELPLEREQMRLAAVALAGIALLAGGIQLLPWLLPRSQAPVQVLLLSLPAFPVTLGYALLRPQVTVLDRRIAQGALWMVRALASALLIVCIVTLLLDHARLRTPHLLVVVALSLAGLGPLLWWGTRAALQRLFAQEMTALRAFLASPPAVASLDEAALVLTSALSLASRSSQVGVYLCEEEGHLCVPLPAAACALPTSPQRHLLTRACACWDLPAPDQSFLVLPQPVWDTLHAHRWLPLHRWQTPTPLQGWRHWQPWAPITGQPDAQELLLLPLRDETRDRVLGLVLVGPAEIRQPYAGADLERIMRVVETATPWFARHRQAEETQRQDRLLSQMYSGLAFQIDTVKPEVIVRHYMELMVSLGASGEVFWRGSEEHDSPWLQAGPGPWLSSEERHLLLHEETAHPQFWSSGIEPRSCAVAVLPLQWATTSLVLLVTYPHPHVFLPREQAYWRILAQHCQQRLDTLGQRATQRVSRQEQATLLTVLAGNLDLLAEEQDAHEAALATRQAVLVARRLLEDASPCAQQTCPDPVMCARCRHE
jgi:hypothetical protein